MELSRRMMGKIRQNMFWALVYNSLGILIAAGVLYPSFGLLLRPEIAAFAMAMSSVSVVSNSLLLRRVKLKRCFGFGRGVAKKIKNRIENGREKNWNTLNGHYLHHLRVKI